MKIIREVAETSKGEVTIPASDNSGSNTHISETFDIDLTGDTDPERDETFKVTISAPSDANATIGSPDIATGTIVSDDQRAFYISEGTPNPIMELDSGTNNLSFAVTLSSGNTKSRRNR